MEDQEGKQDMSEQEVRHALGDLASRGLLDWQGEDIVYFTPAQAKLIARYYENEEEQ
jgi:hypothetical protein